MIVKYTWGEHEYTINLHKGKDISIPLSFKIPGPNCFYAPMPSVNPVRSGDFIGDTAQGGLLNFKNITLNPHGNGTHTECVGHIAKEEVFINRVLTQFHHIGQVVSIYPTLHENGDRIISLDSVRQFITYPTPVVIFRTLPNEEEKLHRVYSGSNPPYFEPAALAYLRDMGIQHFMTDLPSVDREEDEGALAAHKAWWQYPDHLDLHKTITEMVFVPDDVPDGQYLVNIQITSMELDASPSKVVLYTLDSRQ